MTKRLCKLNRRDISDNLGDIHRLVAEPKFLCRSCSRSSADKSTLCKPAAIPPASCQSKPLTEQQQCGVLAEALPTKTTPKLTKTANKAEPKSATDVPMAEELSLETVDKKSLKRAKKALKAQKKAQKKLRKVLKKSQKLLRKQSKLEHKYQLAAATVEKQVMKVQPEQLH